MKEVKGQGRLLRDEIRRIKENHKGFHVAPFYSKIGDFVSIYLCEKEAYSVRVDDVLTLYRAIDGDEIVGFKIKGVSILAKNVYSIFEIVDGDVDIRMLLLSATGTSPHRQFYYDLGVKILQMPDINVLKIKADQIPAANAA